VLHETNAIKRPRRNDSRRVVVVAVTHYDKVYPNEF
jgi:hypothetical protein